MKLDRPALRTMAMLGLAFLLCACGGGEGIYPARGEVFLKGKPAAGAVIHLHPKNAKKPPAFATVQADGSFHLTTYIDKDGAAVGDYAVTITWRDEKQKDGETIYSPDRFNNRFHSAANSGLKATVQPGSNVLPRFDLK